MYVKPLAQVFQEFEVVPTGVVDPMRAFIVGANYQLVRYTKSTEKANGLLGEYDSAAEQTCFDYPNREVGATVDQAYTRLFADNALLQYFTSGDVVGANITAPYCDDNTLGKNQIISEIINWKTSGEYTRHASLKNRDVKVGDQVKIVGVVDGDPVTFRTQVSGFSYEAVAAVISAARTITGENQATIGSTTKSVSQTAGVNNNVQLQASDIVATGYNGLADDNVAEVYTVEVTQSGNPDDPDNLPLLSVRSASGNDDADDVVPEAFGDQTAIGARGLTAAFTLAEGESSSSGDAGGISANWFHVGQTWVINVQHAYTKPTVTDNAGTYTGTKDTTYVVTVTKGGVWADEPEITISTTNGADTSGPHKVTGTSVNVAIGSYGVIISFGAASGLCKNDRWYIDVTAEAQGAATGLILAKNLPAGLLGQDGDGVCGTAPALTVTLYIKKNIEIPRNRYGHAPEVNFTTNATQICVQSGVLGTDASWVDDDGSLLDMPLAGGTLYAHYRAFLPTFVDSISAGATDATTAALGVVDPENPLAYGVSKARANANGTDVYWCAIADNELASWSKALNLASQRDGLYGFVPLTFDRAVHNLFSAHVASLSSPDRGRWRKAFVSYEFPTLVKLVGEYEGDVVLATIKDDPNADGDQYTFVEFVLSGTQSNFSLTDLGVRPGDLLKFSFQTDGFDGESSESSVIDAVLSDDSLRLASGPALPINEASRVEIWRSRTAADIATDVAAVSGSYASRRMHSIYPDYLEADSQLVPGYFAAAAIAGLRSGVVPHQGLTEVEIAGFDSVNKVTKVFSDDQLDIMAGSGTWIITRDPATNTIYTRHALTTLQTDLNRSEEQVTANVDSISYLCLRAMRPFIGRSNVTPSNLAQISTELKAVLTALTTSTSKTLGPQLIDFTIVSVEQHPVNKDRVVAVVRLTIPYALNNLEVHLVI